MKKFLKNNLLTKIATLALIITFLVLNFCFIANAATATSGGRTYTTDSGASISAYSVSSDYKASIQARKPDAASWYRTQAGLWYYFENDRVTTKRGWFNDATDGQTYYLDPDTGIMLVGWILIDGNYYYFNESHNNENNWREVGNGFFESLGKKVKAYGSMFKDEYTPDGKKVDASGRLIEGNNDNNSLFNDIINSIVDQVNIYEPGDDVNPTGTTLYAGHQFYDLDMDGEVELIIYRKSAYGNLFIDSVYKIENKKPIILDLTPYGNINSDNFDTYFGNKLKTIYKDGATKDDVFYPLKDGKVARVSYHFGSLEEVLIYDFNNKTFKKANKNDFLSLIGYFPGDILHK